MVIYSTALQLGLVFIFLDRFTTSRAAINLQDEMIFNFANHVTATSQLLLPLSSTKL